MKEQRTEIPAGNRRLAKKRVKCLNEGLYFASSSVLTESSVLRNPLLRQSPKRYLQTHMKYILFISVVILTSCFNSNYEKFSLDKSKIDFIEIRKRVDTVSIRLSENQIDSLIAKLENSEPKQPLYIFAEYYLKVHFIDGYTIEYATQQGTVRGNGGLTYIINDKEYFKNLWFEQSGLSKNHYEYFPTYQEEGEIFQVIETLNQDNLESIKNVLSENGHKWIDIRGVLFYEGKISDEQLVDYTAKARKKI
jgi:hypothetical protein